MYSPGRASGPRPWPPGSGRLPAMESRSTPPRSRRRFAMGGAAARLPALVLAAVVAVSCAAKAPVRPSGTAAPAPAAVGHFDALTTHCTGLRTLTAELSLSGHAGDQRV